MIAGSFAILIEQVSIFPIDSLKTHIRCDIQLVKDKGIFRLWRGVSATFSRCNPGELH
jgi:hypothetical protein